MKQGYNLPAAPSIVPQRIFLPIAQMLTSGGDARIISDPLNGCNKYGCAPTPDLAILAYGSSTASTITPRSLAAAERLRLRLMRASRLESAAVTYARELERIRSDLIGLCGLDALSGVDVIFAASGTDIHLISAQIACANNSSALLVVMIDPNETGSGVPAALAGRHFSDHTALGHAVAANAGITGAAAVEVAVVASRRHDGDLRASALIDDEVEALVVAAAAAGRRVLINLVDVSKTGMIAPSIGCALDLRTRFADVVDILVDGCQFRLAPATLQAYLQQGFWVALTGSKFVGGPAFSGALLLPQAAVSNLRSRQLPLGLHAYSACAEWPAGWAARKALPPVENYGLLLRWEAALAELSAFRALPEPAIGDFLDAFAAKVLERLSSDSAFSPVPLPPLDRRPLLAENSWDRRPTIFPFFLCHHGAPLSREMTTRVHTMLAKGGADLAGLASPKSPHEMHAVAAQRCQLGQPVVCGVFDGRSISALRLCASARLVVDAISPQGRGPEVVIAEALLALDKTALLARAVSKDSLKFSN